MNREQKNHYLTETKLIVIKVGSARVSGNYKDVNDFLFSLVDDIRYLYDKGKKIILVTSGAVAQGRKSLENNFSSNDFLQLKPSLPQKQALAALGQNKLMNLYEDFFSKVNINIAQILFGLSDIREKNGFHNLKNTFYQLLDWGVLPIVNENDSTATEELKLGDNDILSALVSILTNADLLLILTGENGFLRNGATVPFMKHITSEDMEFAKGPVGPGTGGMHTKLKAANIISNVGIPTAIINGKEQNCVKKFFRENKSGTLIFPDTSKKTQMNEKEIKELFKNQFKIEG